MRLICVGDSWTMGHGVEEDIKYKEIAFPIEAEAFIPKLRMCNGWPKWLSNKFDCEFIPVGECGGNNERIGNSIEELIRNDFIKKTDIIIVMFSYPYRDTIGPITNYNRIENLLINYKHFYFNSFYPTFKNEEEFDINELPEYFIEPDKCVSDILRQYEIANDISVWEYGSRSVYDDTQNFYVGDYHPNLLGYKLIAEYIYEKIKGYIEMDKYTVIIPTLWKSDRTKKLINDLRECEYVDEIIIIDNSSLEEINISHAKKVRMVSKGKNIYVNPAWNWGIELAKNECIALCNDDINFDPNIFAIINKDILSKFGIIGQSEHNYKGNNTDEPIIETWIGGVRDWGWGCLILFNKKDWINIPNDIKIWYGDDFIFKYNNITKSILKNFNIQTEMSTTSDEKEWDEIKKKDYEYFINFKQNAKRI